MEGWWLKGRVEGRKDGETWTVGRSRNNVQREERDNKWDWGSREGGRNGLIMKRRMNVELVLWEEKKK